MVATRWLSQRLEQDVRAEEEAELYRLESGASAKKDVDEVPRRVLLALPMAKKKKRGARPGMSLAGL